MRLKDSSVQLSGVHYLLWYAAVVYDIVHQQLTGAEGTITSALDGQHAANSWHYHGRAIDGRTRDIPQELLPQFVALLEVNLPPPHFRVLLEQDHVHIEAPVPTYPGQQYPA